MFPSQFFILFTLVYLSFAVFEVMETLGGDAFSSLLSYLGTVHVSFLSDQRGKGKLWLRAHMPVKLFNNITTELVIK